LETSDNSLQSQPRELALKLKAALLVAALLVTFTSLFAGKKKSSLPEQLVGTWKLRSIEAEYPDGRIDAHPELGPRASGYLIYETDGHMCTQLMNPDRFDWRKPGNPTPAEAKVAVDGYVAYCGRYEVYASEGVVIHHKEVSLVPNQANTSVRRWFTLSGNRLVLRVAEETRTGVTLRYRFNWERVQ
jgi:hypothetical protein